MADEIGRKADETAARLRALLEEARIDIRRRLAEREPGGSREEILRQMDAAVTGALQHAGSQMEQELAAARSQTIDLGVQAAVDTLPQAEARVLFHLDAMLLQALAVWEADLVQDVTGDLRRHITRQVQLGTLAGKSMREITDEITAARTVKGEGLVPIGPWKDAHRRAGVIAVTETHRIANVAIHARYEDAAARIPGLMKRWVTAEDGRVRPTHFLLEGKTLPMDALFEVGGFKAKHPLDPALPASESVNCRCRMVAVPPEDLEDEDGRHAIFGLGGTTGSGQEGSETETAGPYPRGFTPAKTVAAAKGYARDVLGVDVDLGENLYAYNNANHALAEARARGETLPRRVRFRASMFREADSGKPEAVAKADPLHAAIYLNPRSPAWSNGGKTARSIARASHLQGLWSSGHELHAMRHELYHLEHHARNADTYLDSTKGWGPTEANIAVRVSTRAAEDAAEFVAEVGAGRLARKRYDREVMRLYRALTHRKAGR